MNKLNKKAFTLIEIAAVIGIIIIILSTTVILIPKGSNYHEAKLVSHSILSILNQCSSLARVAGKVYMADIDISYSHQIKDPSEDISKADDMYRFSAIRLYSATWGGAAIKYKFIGESLEIPVSIAAYCNFSPGDNDYIYFKPDGNVSTESDADIFIVTPAKNIQQYYKIHLAKDYGSFKLESFKET